MGVREAATCVGLSLCHIKRLVKKLRKARGDFRTLLFQRQHPAWNKLPRDIRNAIVMLKEERPTRSNPFITELMNELHSIKVHPTMMRNILIEAGKYNRSRERRRPAIQFEAKAFGEINQMDSTSGAWLEGYRQILCFKEIRKVAKENSFNLDGITYTIPRQHNMVAFKVRLRI